MKEYETEQFKKGLQESLDGKGTIIFTYTNSQKETKLRRVDVEKIEDTFKGFTFRGVDRSADDEHRCFRLDRVVSYYYVDNYKKPYIISVKTTGYWIDEYEVEAESEEQAREEYFNNGGYQLNDNPIGIKDYEHEIESVRPDFIEEDWD